MKPVLFAKNRNVTARQNHSGNRTIAKTFFDFRHSLINVLSIFRANQNRWVMEPCRNCFRALRFFIAELIFRSIVNKIFFIDYWEFFNRRD